MIRIALRMILIATFLAVCAAGCAQIPIKDGELALNANTSATLDDVGVARVNRKF